MYEDEIEDIPKTATEIAKRALVLSAVITTAYGAPSSQVMDWLEQEGLINELTPEERKFVSGEGTEKDRINFSWKVEALTPLLWAIQKIDHFPSFTDQVDTSLLKQAVVFPPAPTKQFIESSKLRDESEISEVYETVYQAHWQVRDAQINGKEIPDSLLSGVVMERHYGFNWLIGYCGQAWDEITTDT
jgi:hypothetical protein